MKTELKTQYDTRKSFYGKAVVEQEENTTNLFSYNTKVATISKDGTAQVFNTHTQTTLRHVKAFLQQNGFRADRDSDRKQMVR